MTDQTTTQAVISAPPGLSIVYKTGGVKPIVALHVTTNGPNTPDVTALYLDHDGSVKPITAAQDVSVAAWESRGAVHNHRVDFYK